LLRLHVGGGNGIGAATVEILCGLGAKVVFGDVQNVAGEKLVKKLSSSTVKFVKTDVTKYGDLIELFDTALQTFERIDCAISNAGVAEFGNWVNPELDLEGIKQVRPQ
jgi:NAD(P)-dependent dehydrogenase (short-subunit alcohol dehydrogenase family)